MKIKVHGGTARTGDPPLCLSCRYASIAAGASANEQVIHCSRLDARIHFPVLSCTRYLHHQHPSLYDMEDIAWILRADTTRNRIGFVRAEDLKARDRHVLDDDTWQARRHCLATAEAHSSGLRPALRTFRLRRTHDGRANRPARP